MSLYQPLKGYEIFEQIGSGAFGRVYKAKRRVDNQELAVKVNMNTVAKDEF